MKNNGISEFEYKGKTYKLAFNMNVIEILQEKYGTFNKWAKLVQPEEEEKETDLKALLFAFTEAINEAIDIENDEKGTNEPPLTTKQVGRIITDIGIQEANMKLQEVVIASSKGDEAKNE